MGPKSIEWYSSNMRKYKNKERIHRDQEGRRPHENGGKDWSNAGTSQRMPELLVTERSRGLFTRAFSGHRALKLLDLKFRASKTLRE
jgi:hypothetical protein